MFRFSREGTKVKIVINAAVPHDTSRDFYCYWDAGSEWAAGLLVELFSNTFKKRGVASRQDAYNQGWADAKAKRQKATWFASWLHQK